MGLADCFTSRHDLKHLIRVERQSAEVAVSHHVQRLFRPAGVHLPLQGAGCYALCSP